MDLALWLLGSFMHALDGWRQTGPQRLFKSSIERSTAELSPAGRSGKSKAEEGKAGPGSRHDKLTWAAVQEAVRKQWESGAAHSDDSHATAKSQVSDEDGSTRRLSATTAAYAAAVSAKKLQLSGLKSDCLRSDYIAMPGFILPANYSRLASA